jgi:hypothetical protein
MIPRTQTRGRTDTLPSASKEAPSSPILGELRPPGCQTQLLGIGGVAACRLSGFEGLPFPEEVNPRG